MEAMHRAFRTQPCFVCKLEPWRSSCCNRCKLGEHLECAEWSLLFGEIFEQAVEPSILARVIVKYEDIHASSVSPPRWARSRR
jgi:hypothetical protein